MNKRKLIMGLVSVLFVVTPFLISSPVAWSQTNYGTIRGTVSDPTGALVPEVEIEAIHVSTNRKYTTPTTEAGVYALINLPLGEYQVTAKRAGFKEAVGSRVIVSVGSTTTLNITLEVGEVTEQVTVEETFAPLLTPDNAEVGTIVERAAIIDLPLSVTGNFRNPENFIRLTPGVTGDVFSKHYNGGTTMSSQILIEGLPASNGDVPGVSDRYGSLPPIDAIEEFKVNTTLFPAEQGRGFGFSSYTLKSGTNSFHGNAWEFLRNDALDARGFFSRNKPIVRQNEFGGTIGGPIFKDKTFFFGTYSGFRRGGGSPVRGTVTLPTPAFRQGDFSQLKDAKGNLIPIFDPDTTNPDGQGGFVRTPFPGNIIPANRISAVAKRVMDLLPDPDFPGIVNNFISRSTTNVHRDVFSVKIDHNLTASHKLYGSLTRMFRNTDESDTALGDNPLDSGYPSGGPTTTWRVNHDWIINTTLLNHFAFGFHGLSGYGRRPDEPKGDLIQLPGTPPGAPGMPAFYIGDLPELGNSDQQPSLRWVQTWNLAESLSWTRGRHQFKFGGEYWRQKYPTLAQEAGGGLSGTFSFSNLETSQPNSPNYTIWGTPLASFLLGQVDYAGKLGQGQRRTMEEYYLAFFADDKIQISPNLTLTLGLRYDIPWAYRDNQRMSAIDLALPNPGAGNRPGAYVFGADKIAAPIDWKEFGPRIGLAYSWNSKTVIRAGYGLLYSQTNATALGGFQAGGNFFEAGFAGAASTIQSPNNGVSSAFHLDSGFPALPSPVDNLVPSINVGSTADYMSPHGGKAGRTHNWMLGIQRELAAGIVLDAAYVGNKGTHLPAGLDNFNQVPFHYLSLGPLLNQDINSPEAIAAGIVSPFPGFSGSVAQALRPYPQYIDIYNPAQPVGNLSYHSFQAKAQKRFNKGLSFLVSYTLSKSLTDTGQGGFTIWNAGPQDIERHRLEKTIAPDDRTHTLVTSWVYELPGKNLRGLAGGILKGWAVSGITDYHSGTPIGFYGGQNTPIFNGADRPNRVPGEPARSNVSAGSFDPDRDLYLNPAAIVGPAPYTIGTAGPSEPDLRGFAFFEENFSLIKRTYIPDIRENFNVELRADFFNLFNRVVFSGPDAGFGSPGFGRVGGQANVPRIIQLGLKFNF